MSNVNAAVMYMQLQKKIDAGEDLADYYICDCDSFGGQAIIIPIEEDEE